MRLALWLIGAVLLLAACGGGGGAKHYTVADVEARFEAAGLTITEHSELYGQLVGAAEADNIFVKSGTNEPIEVELFRFNNTGRMAGAEDSANDLSDCVMRAANIMAWAYKCDAPEVAVVREVIAALD